MEIENFFISQKSDDIKQKSIKINIMGSNVITNQSSCHHHFGNGQQMQFTKIKSFYQDFCRLHDKIFKK